MASIIYASDGTNSLIRNRGVAQIGKIHDEGKRYLPNGECRKVILIEFDFEGDFITDYWYFSEEGLEFNFTDNRRDPFMQKIYKEAAKAKDINTFLNCVVGSYTARAMGFIEE